MNVVRPWKFRLVAALSLALAGCGPTTSTVNANAGDTASDSSDQELDAIPEVAHVSVCGGFTGDGNAHCYATAALDGNGHPLATAAPQGFGPPDLQDAYNLPSTGGAGKWVAIVDANDDPSAEADLAAYRKKYGLKACTTANGCFKKLNQKGVQGSYPTVDEGWAVEIALDLDMVSAACPDCNIMLVEADSASYADLGTAVNTAVTKGATVVSNSYGGSESSSVKTYETKYYKHTGVAIFASSGDSGYGVGFPASSQYVTAVGGTKLAKSTTKARGWTEGVWGSTSNTNGGTGSGCSAYITKPSWQKDGGCTKRNTNDISAVADPSTGVAVYVTNGDIGGETINGWTVLGGTSASSPLVAAIYTLTGHGAATPELSYSHTTAFNDVTSGSNGTCSSAHQYLCKGKKGYDGPTGNGTPDGTKLAAISGN